MPQRELLSPAQRDALFAPPTAPDDLVRLYTLTAEDRALIGRKRRPHNRLGFAVQLCLLRHPGRALVPEEAPPAEILAFVGQQLAIDPRAFGCCNLRSGDSSGGWARGPTRAAARREGDIPIFRTVEERGDRDAGAPG